VGGRTHRRWDDADKRGGGGGGIQARCVAGAGMGGRGWVGGGGGVQEEVRL
jgi:hypothetical protein